MGARITMWKLKKMGKAFVTGSKDMRNAFGSGRRADLHEALAKHASDTTDIELLAQRRFEARAIIDAPDKEIVVQNHSGGLMGCSN